MEYDFSLHERLIFFCKPKSRMYVFIILRLLVSDHGTVFIFSIESSGVDVFIQFSIYEFLLLFLKTLQNMLIYSICIISKVLTL